MFRLIGSLRVANASCLANALRIVLCGAGLLAGPSLCAAGSMHTTELGASSLALAVDWPTSHRVHVLAQLLIPASAARVWAVLTDYDHLADFVPYLSASRTLERQDGQLLLQQEGGIGFPLYRRTVRVTFCLNEVPPSTISFQAIEGDFTVHEGSWRIGSEAGGTFVTYEAIIEPGFWVPRWVFTLIERQMLKATFRAILERCVS